MNTWLPLLFTLILLPSCAVLRVYDVKETKTAFDQALLKTDQALGKAQTDFKNKSAIWTGITAKPPANKDGPLQTAQTYHQSMKSKLELLQKHQSKLHVLHNQFVHLAGNSKKITSTEGRWDSVTHLREDFKSEAEQLNLALAQYSDSSNAFAQTLTENQLFTQVKPGDVVGRINEAISLIAQVDARLAQDLDGKEVAYNKFKTRQGPTQAAREREMFLLIEDMSEIRKQIQLKNHRLEQIRDDFAKKNKGKSIIRSIDPDWAEVEEVKMDYDSARQQVEALSTSYSKKAESFALSLKEGTEESRQ